MEGWVDADAFTMVHLCQRGAPERPKEKEKSSCGHEHVVIVIILYLAAARMVADTIMRVKQSQVIMTSQSGSFVWLEPELEGVAEIDSVSD